MTNLIVHLRKSAEYCAPHGGAAFNLALFFQAGLLPQAEVEQLLYQAARTIGLGDSEPVKTIASVLQTGIYLPRRHWPDL